MSSDYSNNLTLISTLMEQNKRIETTAVDANVTLELERLEKIKDYLRKLAGSNSHRSDVLFDALRKLKTSLSTGDSKNVEQALDTLVTEYNRFGGSTKVSKIIKEEKANFVEKFKTLQ